MSRKCSECGAYKGHHPLCKNITGASAKKQLVMYYESWLAFELQRRQWNLGLKPDRSEERKGHTCWVYCPLCGKDRDMVDDEWGFLYWLARKKEFSFENGVWDKHCFQILEQLYAKYKGWV